MSSQCNTSTQVSSSCALEQYFDVPTPKSNDNISLPDPTPHNLSSALLVVHPTVPPQQPKKKRKQVKNACTLCQKACKKCDDARPCFRCVNSGTHAECKSSTRKERKPSKRGPYKKRISVFPVHLSSGIYNLYFDHAGTSVNHTDPPVPPQECIALYAPGLWQSPPLASTPGVQGDGTLAYGTIVPIFLT